MTGYEGDVKKSRIAALAAIPVIASAALTGCMVLPPSAPAFDAILSTCLDRELAADPEDASLEDLLQSMYDSTFTVSTSGDTLSVDTNSGIGSMVMGSSVACVLEETGAPQSVWERIASTRALDGTQSAEWDQFSATWTYHPDAGHNVVIARY